MKRVKIRYKSIDKKYRTKTVKVDLPCDEYGFIRFGTLTKQLEKLVDGNLAHWQILD